MSQLRATYEDIEREWAGAVLQQIREAGGLTETHVAEAGIASRGGLRKWEAGEPGVRIVRYIMALARMSPLARHALITAIDGGAVRVPDPHVARLVDVMERMTSRHDWPTIAMHLEGLLKASTPNPGIEGRAPPHHTDVAAEA